jgi:hypothetical protein
MVNRLMGVLAYGSAPRQALASVTAQPRAAMDLNPHANPPHDSLRRPYTHGRTLARTHARALARGRHSCSCAPDRAGADCSQPVDGSGGGGVEVATTTTTATSARAPSARAQWCQHTFCALACRVRGGSESESATATTSGEAEEEEQCRRACHQNCPLGGLQQFLFMSDAERRRVLDGVNVRVADADWRAPCSSFPALCGVASVSSCVVV